MSARDLLRSLLDILDRESEEESCGCNDQEPCGCDETDIPAEQGEPVASRFRQILAMLQNDNPMYDTPYANTPNEIVADVDSVTTLAGGGLNGPKHPADFRVKDPGYGHGG